MTKTSHLPIRYLLALLWAHPILHISTIRVNWLPFATFCTVMCETPSGLIILHRAAGTMYRNISRFSQWTFPKLIPAFLCSYEELFINTLKLRLVIRNSIFIFTFCLFIYLFITSDNTDCDIKWRHILCCTSTWRLTKRLECQASSKQNCNNFSWLHKNDGVIKLKKKW